MIPTENLLAMQPHQVKSLSATSSKLMLWNLFAKSRARKSYFSLSVSCIWNLRLAQEYFQHFCFWRWIKMKKEKNSLINLLRNNKSLKRLLLLIPLDYFTMNYASRSASTFSNKNIVFISTHSTCFHSHIL